MNKNDFTPEFIESELLEYIINHDFPDDELSEIGSVVSITGLSDIEIISVKESGVNFIIDGLGVLETETDMGEGATASGKYAMTFSYEFDEDGEILKQHSRHIDTSSFFLDSSELDDEWIRSIPVSSEHLPVFQSGILDIVSLLGENLQTPRKCMHRLLYVNVITTLESYLSDFFISRIKTDPVFLRKLIETTPTFREQKMTVGDVFQTMEGIEKRANSYLAGLVWHRIDRVGTLYQNVLGISFPADLRELSDAIGRMNIVIA